MVGQRVLIIKDKNMMASITVYTIGHSNHTVENFSDLLMSAGIQTLIDIMAQPFSKHNPQFNEPALREVMDSVGIIYHLAGRQLGGKRPAQANSPHITLDEGLRGFADYMQTGHFERAISQLVNLAGRSPTVIMCAEAKPTHCHRALIADYLLLQGYTVIHILDDGTQQEHQLGPAVRRESLQLIYDRNATNELPL